MDTSKDTPTLPEPFATMLPLLHDASKGRTANPRLVVVCDIADAIDNKPEFWQEIVDFYTWAFPTASPRANLKHSLDMTTQLLSETYERSIEHEHP